MSAPISLADIDRAVCAAFDMKRKDLVSPVRKAKFVRPRHIAMYLARLHTNRSFPQLGEHFGRDHSSVMHGVRRVEAALAVGDPRFVEKLQLVLQNLDETPRMMERVRDAIARGGLYRPPPAPWPPRDPFETAQQLQLFGERA